MFFLSFFDFPLLPFLGINLSPLPHPYCVPPISEFYSKEIHCTSSLAIRRSLPTRIQRGFGDWIIITTLSTRQYKRFVNVSNLSFID